MQLLTTALVMALSAGGPATIRVSEGGDGYNGVISADGRHVAFTSGSSPFTPADTNGTTDAYVRNLRTGAVTLASVTPSGAAGNSDSYDVDVSADGRYVSVTSSVPDLVRGDTNGNADCSCRMPRV